MVCIPAPIRRRAAPRRLSLLSALACALAHGPAVCAADVELSWTGDFASVVEGGLQRGETHLGLVELALGHGLTVGQREVELFAAAQHVYGGGLSGEYVGDLQTISNADAASGTRVLEAWIDVALSETASLRAGRYDFNGEFDVIDAGGLFLHSSHGIGADISQTGAAGPSIFPHTALALRLDYDFGGGRIARAVALDLESDPDGDYGSVPFQRGPMLAFEYEFGPAETTRWKAGAWGFTRSRPALADPDERDREYGAYASVQHRPAGQWVGYLRLGVANDDVSRLGAYLGAGLVHEGGLLPARDDAIGLAIAHARNGDAYRDAMRRDGVATTAAETAVELTWRVPLGEHLVLQPDLQYVFAPDTNPALDDAFVVLLRVELRL